jgi:hypothetical protein
MRSAKWWSRQLALVEAFVSLATAIVVLASAIVQLAKVL